MLPDLDRLVATISQQTNYVDILFANAGVLSQSLPIGEVSENEFDATFNVNVKAVFFTVQKLLPLLRDGASIIINASAVSAKGLPAYSVYTATKAAVRSFARTWSSDLKARQIRVNAVSPGPIETPMMTAGKSEEELRQHKASLSSVVPVGRVGQPDDVAKAVVFLASSDSSFITGIELFVDGGMAQV
jgi:NAD(P)-dependent dehydrogenase (short-subunit alcohol dehydrogenase family)